MLVESRAFREAALKSEIGRAYAVIAVVVLVAVLAISRELTGEVDDRLPKLAIVGVGALLVIQVVVLRVARWARLNDRGIPSWFVVSTVVVESLVPTGIMLLLCVSGSLPPFAVLSAPPVVAYGILFMLTTLRLSPILCVLAAVVSAGGYGGILAYVKFGLGLRTPTAGLPPAAYFSFTVLILIGGLAAAWVAWQIRGHVEAALTEAETRRKVERIEQDMSVARTIQRALLPVSAPKIPGYDVAGWNRPADQTGGDYYDWQLLPDGNWIISLADVSGHGIGPALVTAACRAYVRASSLHDGNLATLTGRVNRLLAEDLPEGRFVTLVSVLIAPGGGPVGLLSAGHGPVLLWAKATGQVRDINPNDVPLAIVPDSGFGPAESVTLAPGDVLALVTDGFFEWSRPSRDGQRDDYGLERLRTSLARHAGKTAAEIVEALAADVGEFARGEPQQDDLTVVVIKRVG